MPVNENAKQAERNEEYRFSIGTEKDSARLYELICRRIDWMNQNGIKQWNCHGYLEKYPLSYYREQARKGRLYLLRHGAKTAAAGILLTEDPRWEEDGQRAVYIHHFVSDPNEKGAGKRFLEKVIQTAEEKKIPFVRLDCAEDNEKLNRYYESLGFVSRESFTEGLYRGLKKELHTDTEKKRAEKQ